MTPRHFWWLYETLGDQKPKRSRLSAEDRRGIMEMLQGNKKAGGFW